MREFIESKRYPFAERNGVEQVAEAAMLVEGSPKIAKATEISGNGASEVGNAAKLSESNVYALCGSVVLENHSSRSISCSKGITGNSKAN
ncbi:hypothetical protein D5086_033983 [Populus alba]|uniref:Uncharacterized protein n=1 Tax=Populus alba TaxID=43335 RepID=A0ACC4AEH9_POPAL